MARHYSYIYSPLHEGTIPAPAVDMSLGHQRFGTSGNYVSGGGYVRRSQFGGQVLNLSWNNLSTEDTNSLVALNESGMFNWTSPLAYRNAVPPWFAAPTSKSTLEWAFLDATYVGLGRENYTLDKKVDSVTFQGLATHEGGNYVGYPLTMGNKYSVNSTGEALGVLVIIPPGYTSYGWVVGETTGSVEIRDGSRKVPINTPTTYQQSVGTINITELPGSVLLPSGARVVNLQIIGEGTFTHSSMQIRVVPTGVVPDATYSPGLGNSGMEFTEEGLQLVQHSAALDLQTAAATWVETGWWK